MSQVLTAQNPTQHFPELSAGQSLRPQARPQVDSGHHQEKSTVTQRGQGAASSTGQVLYGHEGAHCSHIYSPASTPSPKTLCGFKRMNQLNLAIRPEAKCHRFLSPASKDQLSRSCWPLAKWQPEIRVKTSEGPMPGYQGADAHSQLSRIGRGSQAGLSERNLVHLASMQPSGAPGEGRRGSRTQATAPGAVLHEDRYPGMVWFYRAAPLGNLVKQGSGLKHHPSSSGLLHTHPQSQESSFPRPGPTYALCPGGFRRPPGIQPPETGHLGLS